MKIDWFGSPLGTVAGIAAMVSVAAVAMALGYSADMRYARVQDAVRLCKAKEGIFLYATETCVPPPAKFESSR